MTSDVDPGPSDGPLSFSQVLDRMETAGTAETVSLGELLGSFGRRAFGPFLLVPALVAILPVVGALPGVSLLTAIIELGVSVQLALGQRGLHLPERIRRVAVPRKALMLSVRLMRPVAHAAGHAVRPRLQMLTTDGGARMAAGVLALTLAALMLIGALIPGGIVLPAIGMIVLALGLTSRDGLLLVIALAFGLGSIGAGLWWML